MKIALYDCDKNIKQLTKKGDKKCILKYRYPNLALMKLSAWHKQKGDIVEWYSPLHKDLYDRIYSSKVFTFSEKDIWLPVNGKVIRGGCGYNLFEDLSDEIEHICPDYSLYNTDSSYGFLTRGCNRNCSWCIVRKKEGYIREHADLKEFLRHNKVIFLDNNVLACKHGIREIEKISKRNDISIDFNQGIDARLIDNNIAKLFAKINWIWYIRLSCDTQSQIPVAEKAIYRLRKYGYSKEIFFYLLITNDIEESLSRAKLMRELYLDGRKKIKGKTIKRIVLYGMPYYSIDGKVKPTRIQKELCHWINCKWIFNTASWDDYKNGIYNNKIDSGVLF